MSQVLELYFRVNETRCERCGAQPGDLCVTASGRRYGRFDWHKIREFQARWNLYV